MTAPGKGESDTVMVVALNTDTGEARGIIIPRDSMVAVDTYSNGSFAGQVTEQLCLQFAYGTDGDNSYGADGRRCLARAR